MNPIITNPNQRMVTVIGEKKKEDEKTYGIITRKAEQIAIHILDDGTASFFLYVHFALHKDQYHFAFSPAALEKELGISKDRCRTAFNRLVKCGYLVSQRNGSNQYLFYELPPQYDCDDWISVIASNNHRSRPAVKAIPSPEAISLSTQISPSEAISSPEPSPQSIAPTIDSPVRYPPFAHPQTEGYSHAQRYPIPADWERNTTQNIINKTSDTTSAEDKGISTIQSEHTVLKSPLDKYSFGKATYDEDGEVDEEIVHALYYIPQEAVEPSVNDDYDGELPF